MWIFVFLKRLLLRLLGRYEKIDFTRIGFEAPEFSKEILYEIVDQHSGATLIFIYRTILQDYEEGPWLYDQIGVVFESDITFESNLDKLMSRIVRFQVEKRFGAWKFDGTRSLDGEEIYESHFWVSVEVYG